MAARTLRLLTLCSVLSVSPSITAVSGASVPIGLPSDDTVRGEAIAPAGDHDVAPWQRDMMLGLAVRRAPVEMVGTSIEDVRSPGSALAASDQGAWIQLPTSARDRHTAIYDPVRERMIVFGGTDGSVSRNDTWELLLSGTPVWRQLSTVGAPPSARSRHTAIYDPVRDRMLIFGGLAGGRLNDVWALSLSDPPTWSQLAPSGGPPSARSNATAIYDPIRDRMLVFGGYSGTTYLDDTWALEFSGAPTWQALAPAGTLPAGRSSHGALYDPIRDRLVIFGGLYATSPFYRNDTWALSLAAGGAWTELTPSGTPPSARYACAVVLDAPADRMLVFGGYDGSALSDVWAVSLGLGSAWSVLAPTGTPPTGRIWPTAIFDPLRDRLVIFGGTTFRNDTWTLSLAGSPAWTELSFLGNLPTRRYGATAIFDPLRQRMIVFGGSDPVLRNDVWSLSLGANPQWTAWVPSGTPPSPRGGDVAVYDPVRHRMLVFGGFDGTGVLSDVWALSLGDTPTWTPLIPTGTPPSGRSGSAGFYDPVRDRLVVYGGGVDETIYDEVWAASLAGTPAWTQIVPGGTHPPARVFHSATYDPVRDRMILFGGFILAGSFNDLWSLSFGATPSWTPLTAAGSPPSRRYAHSATFDPVRDRLVVFAGDDGSERSDSYALSMGASPAWSPLVPTGAPPDVRIFHAAVDDPVADRLIVFGGSHSLRNDTWDLHWGAATTPDIVCPADFSWTSGQNVAITYQITSHFGTPEGYDFVLSSARNWPGWPVAGTLSLDASETRAVPITVAVPDTAANGRNALRLEVRLHTTPAIVGSCQHNIHDVSTATAIALVRVEVGPDRVRLVWFDAERSGTVATVWKRGASTEWVPIGTVFADGGGELIFVDDRVEPGARYGYHLGVGGDGHVEYTPEVWVDIPRTLELTLDGMRPNPSSRNVSVSFRLPSGEPTSLEVLDVSGRLMVHREVGSLGPGSHVLELADPRLPPGVYLLRLTQAARSLTARAVIVR